MENPTAPNLTQSRIVRLFRPLRARCKQLNVVLGKTPSSSKHSTHITYDSRNRAKKTSRTPTDPPHLQFSITPIPPPRSVALALEDRDRSRALYDIRDCFHNIIQACFGGSATRRTSSQTSSTKKSSIPSLAALAATVVGRTIEKELHESMIEEDEDVSFISQVYEGIPPHHWSHAVLAHALSIILDSCPHHPTLLLALLTTCVEHGLVSEASLLLEKLIFVVTHSPTSPSISPSPLLQITVPMHSEYFIALLKDYTSAQASYPSLSPIGFTRILINVLSEARPGYLEVWISMAIRKLGRRLREEDFVAYTHLCTALAHTIASLRILPKSQTIEYREIMESRLAQWLEAGLKTLRTLKSPSALNATIVLLDSMRELRCSSVFPSPELLNAVQRLAIFCLASPMYPPPPAESAHGLVCLLQELKPSSYTYEPLIRNILQDLGLIMDPPYVLSALEQWASGLRSHSLLTQEVCLWTSALQSIDSCTLAGGTSSSNASPLKSLRVQDFEILRIELLSKVEYAEDNCFGETDSMPVDPSERRNMLGDGDWVWEEMVGTWVKRSPLVVKKTKKAAPLLQRELRSLLPNRASRKRLSDEHASANSGKRQKIEPIKYPTSESSTNPVSSASSSSSSSYRSSRSSKMSRSPSPTRVRGVIVDITPPSSPLSPSLAGGVEVEASWKPSPPTAMRRISNFNSILADAHSNVTVLHRHSKSRTHSKKRHSLPNPLPSHHRSPRKLKPSNLDPKRTVATDLSSDDALNLFAASSPVVTRTQRQ